MRSSYKRLGPYIREIVEKNSNLQVELLLGVSVSKEFIPSIANTIGTDMSRYKVVQRNQFAYGPVTSRNSDKISIALLSEPECIISTSYTVFEIIDEGELLPEYLMMWFRRPEFDRYARFKSHGSVRELFGWGEMCDIELPIPSIEKQQEIVKEFQTVVDRIGLNEQLNKKLEEAVQDVYKKYFVDLDTSSRAPLGKLVSFNPKHTIKKGEPTPYIEMADVREDALNVRGFRNREFTAGSKFMNDDVLLARITPCLENGKTAFVNCLGNEEIGFGSTEFIVMRAKENVSPYWVYCTAREGHFREYAISSMVGSSGRQRVHSDYLEIYEVPAFNTAQMDSFHQQAGALFHHIRLVSAEIASLDRLQSTLLGLMASRGRR